MAEDAKAEELVDQLRDQFATQIRDTLRDVPPHQALQLADTLCAVQLSMLAGLRVNYKAAARIDEAAIVEDWARGLTLADITKKHGISKSTAYNYHPGKPARRRRSA